MAAKAAAAYLAGSVDAPPPAAVDAQSLYLRLLLEASDSLPWEQRFLPARTHGDRVCAEATQFPGEIAVLIREALRHGETTIAQRWLATFRARPEAGLLSMTRAWHLQAARPALDQRIPGVDQLLSFMVFGERPPERLTGPHGAAVLPGGISMIYFDPQSLIPDGEADPMALRIRDRVRRPELVDSGSNGSRMRSFAADSADDIAFVLADARDRAWPLDQHAFFSDLEWLDDGSLSGLLTVLIPEGAAPGEGHLLCLLGMDTVTLPIRIATGLAGTTVRSPLFPAAPGDEAALSLPTMVAATGIQMVLTAPNDASTPSRVIAVDTSDSSNVARFRVPLDLPPGRYQAALRHAGRAGDTCLLVVPPLSLRLPLLDPAFPESPEAWRFFCDVPDWFATAPPPTVDPEARAFLFVDGAMYVARADYMQRGGRRTLTVDVPRALRGRMGKVLPAFRTARGWAVAPESLEGRLGPTAMTHRVWQTGVTGEGELRTVRVRAPVPESGRMLLQIRRCRDAKPSFEGWAAWEESSASLTAPVPQRHLQDSVVLMRLLLEGDEDLSTPWWPIYTDPGSVFLAANYGIGNFTWYDVTRRAVEAFAAGGVPTGGEWHYGNYRATQTRDERDARFINLFDGHGRLVAAYATVPSYGGYFECDSSPGPTPLEHDLIKDATRPSELGSFIAEALRAEMGADFGIMNASGIRGHIPRRPSVDWLARALPYGDTIVVLALSRSDVENLLARRGSIDLPFDISPARTSTEEPGPELYSVAVTSYLLGRPGFEELSGARMIPAPDLTTFQALERHVRRLIGTQPSP